MAKKNVDFVGSEDGIFVFLRTSPGRSRDDDIICRQTNSDGNNSSALPELPGCSTPLSPSKCSIDMPPPSYLECSAEHFPSTEAEVRSVLEEHYHGSAWYRRKSVNKMQIIRIKPMNAYYYILDAFTEKRILVTMNQPFIKEYIDGKTNGPVPSKWDVSANPTVPFAKCSYSVNLPHSDSVVSCPHCDGVGRNTCSKCKGKVLMTCTACDGNIDDKNDVNVTCGHCKSTGKVDCNGCTSAGTSQCSMCKGHKAIKYWQVVEIDWDCCASAFITERDDLNAKHFLEVKGWERLNILNLGENTQRNELLKNAGIKDKAEEMLKSILAMKGQELKILEIRQRLLEIPVIKVLYKLKDEEGYLYIYGLERKVYLPKPFRYNFGNGTCVCF